MKFYSECFTMTGDFSQNTNGLARSNICGSAKSLWSG